MTSGTGGLVVMACLWGLACRPSTPGTAVGQTEPTPPAERPQTRTAAQRALDESAGDTSYVAEGSDGDAARGALAAPAGRKWGGWRYDGDRGQCFYIVGRRCAATEEEACTAARCAEHERCVVVGSGPARIECRRR